MSVELSQVEEIVKKVSVKVYNEAIDHAIKKVNEVREIGCDPSADISLVLVIAKLVNMKL